jgi:hypothetical protein
MQIKRKINKQTNRRLGFLSVQAKYLSANSTIKHFATELDLGLPTTFLLGLLLWFALQKTRKENKTTEVLKPAKDGVSKVLLAPALIPNITTF